MFRPRRPLRSSSLHKKRLKTASAGAWPLRDRRAGDKKRRTAHLPRPPGAAARCASGELSLPLYAISDIDHALKTLVNTHRLTSGRDARCLCLRLSSLGLLQPLSLSPPLSPCRLLCRLLPSQAHVLQHVFKTTFSLHNLTLRGQGELQLTGTDTQRGVQISP